jgi:hypothetical protein
VARKTQELESEEPDRRNEVQRPAVDLAPVSGAIESLSRQFATAIKTLDAENQADNRERRNYEANEFWWTRVAAIAGIGFSVFSLLLSGLTLWVLGSTLGVYRGQATIMATQADISKAQTDIGGGQLAQMRLGERPVIGESKPATIVPYSIQVCSGKTWPRPPTECHTENGRMIKVCFKNVGKAGARVLINGHNLANMAPAVPSSEFDVAKFSDCQFEYFATEDQFMHRGVSPASLGPFVLFSGDERCYTSWPGIRADPADTLADFNAGRGTYFVGCVDYEDALHTHYQLQVCRYLDVRSNTVKTCPAYDFESEYKPEDNPLATPVPTPAPK